MIIHPYAVQSSSYGSNMLTNVLACAETDNTVRVLSLLEAEHITFVDSKHKLSFKDELLGQAWSKDGAIFATLTKRKLELYRCNTSDLEQTSLLEFTPPCSLSARCIALSHDYSTDKGSSYLLALGGVNGICLYILTVSVDGAEIKLLHRLHEGWPVIVITFSKHFLAVGVLDGHCGVWTLPKRDTGAQLVDLVRRRFGNKDLWFTVITNGLRICSINFSNNEENIIISSWNGIVTLIDRIKGEKNQWKHVDKAIHEQFNLPRNTETSLTNGLFSCFSPNDECIVFTDQNNKISLYHIYTRRIVGVFDVQGDPSGLITLNNELILYSEKNIYFYEWPLFCRIAISILDKCPISLSSTSLVFVSEKKKVFELIAQQVENNKIIQQITISVPFLPSSLFGVFQEDGCIVASDHEFIVLAVSNLVYLYELKTKKWKLIISKEQTKCVFRQAIILFDTIWILCHKEDDGDLICCIDVNTRSQKWFVIGEFGRGKLSKDNIGCCCFIKKNVIISMKMNKDENELIVDTFDYSFMNKNKYFNCENILEIIQFNNNNSNDDDDDNNNNCAVVVYYDVLQYNDDTYEFKQYKINKSKTKQLLLSNRIIQLQ